MQHKTTGTTKVLRIAYKPNFWLFSTLIMLVKHNYWPFPASWLTLALWYHFYLSEYAVSAHSNKSTSIKGPKTSFPALFCLNYANYANSINYAWPLTMTKCWETFWTIIICNTRSIRPLKLQKMAKNLIFGSFFA